MEEGGGGETTQLRLNLCKKNQKSRLSVPVWSIRIKNNNDKKKKISLIVDFGSKIMKRPSDGAEVSGM